MKNTLNINSKYFYFFVVLILAVFIYLEKISVVEYKINLIKKIEDIENKNQELTLLLFSYESKLNLLRDERDNGILNYTYDSKASELEFTELIERKIESKMVDNISILRNEIMNTISLNEAKNLINQKFDFNKNRTLIEKNYSNINDERFKSNLILTDEIIDRALYDGIFTELDAEILNNLAKDLDYDDRIYIMNKLVSAYNSQKITGNFINFNLVSEKMQY